MLEPIIDNTRHPISVWRRSRSKLAATARIAWLNVLRPFMLLLVWLATLDYLYWEFIRAIQASHDDTRFLQYCALTVAVLLGLMMVAARAVRDRETHENARADTLTSAATRTRRMAVAARIPERDLSMWQHARNVVAVHDETGRFLGAVIKPLVASPVADSAAGHTSAV
jgi:poly-beta-1,6-N-acetyl-D-glucosamine biosynthesis protein PgaD